MVRNAGLDRTHMIQAPQHISQSSLPALDRQIDQAILAKPETVDLDLSAVHTIDSPGLNWLLAAQTRLAAQGIQLRLHDPPAICRDIFLATRLEGRFRFIVSGGSNGAERPQEIGHV